MKCNCGALVEWYWRRRPKVLGERPASVPLFSPQVARNILGSKPGLRCTRPMSNRWSHRRTCSTCVFNFEVDKPTNYHLATLFHFINKMCQFVNLCVPNEFQKIYDRSRYSYLFFTFDSKLFWKLWGLPKVLLTPAKWQIPNMLFINCFLQKEASLETPDVPT